MKKERQGAPSAEDLENDDDDGVELFVRTVSGTTSARFSQRRTVRSDSQTAAGEFEASSCLPDLEVSTLS